jgi:hypothetical protein
VDRDHDKASAKGGEEKTPEAQLFWEMKMGPVFVHLGEGCGNSGEDEKPWHFPLGIANLGTAAEI